MRIDLTGTPSVVEAESAAPGIALASEIVTPAPLTNSLNGIVRDLLDANPAAQYIIINPHARKITAASGAAGLALMQAFVAESESIGALTPDDGQSGRSLLFTADGELPNMAPDIQAAVEAAINAQRPRRSVESLVGAILGAELPDDKGVAIVVNQVDGDVRVVQFESVAQCAQQQAAVDAIANAGDRVQIELSEPAEPGVAAPLVFEGGEV